MQPASLQGYLKSRVYFFFFFFLFLLCYLRLAQAFAAYKFVIILLLDRAKSEWRFQDAVLSAGEQQASLFREGCCKRRVGFDQDCFRDKEGHCHFQHRHERAAICALPSEQRRRDGQLLGGRLEQMAQDEQDEVFSQGFFGGS